MRSSDPDDLLKQPLNGQKIKVMGKNEDDGKLIDMNDKTNNKIPVQKELKIVSDISNKKEIVPRNENISEDIKDNIAKEDLVKEENKDNNDSGTKFGSDDKILKNNSLKKIDEISDINESNSKVKGDKTKNIKKERKK